MTPDSPVVPATPRRLGPKHVFFGFLGLATLFVLYNNERFIVDHSDPLWDYYRTVRSALVPHGVAGAVALILGATQFSTWLRERHTRWHRIFGRCYLVGVAVAASVSIYITLAHNALPLQVAIFTQAFLWVLASATAFYCVLRGNYVLHRQFMIRSYAITLIFVFDRLFDAIPGVVALDSDTDPTVLWLCNVLAWVLPTYIVAWPALRKVPGAAPATSRT